MNSFTGAMFMLVHAFHGHSTAAQRQRWLGGLLWLSLIALALFTLFIDSAWAATSQPIGGETAEFTLFDSLETDAEEKSNSWFDVILALVRPTFLILATIEICWAAAIWAFEKDNLSSLAVEIIKKIMFIGFFFTLLQFAPEWIPTITATFQEVGETASGTGPITTDGIIATGLALIKLVWSEAPTGLFSVLGKLGQILVACFVTIGIIIAYVVLAAQYFTLKIESYILFAAGAIFLGLGSSSWTKEYVSKYLNYAINVGVRLLVLILVLSLLLSTVSDMGASFSFDYTPLLKLLAVAILQAILGIKAPEMAGALLSGGIGLSAGSATGAVSSAMGGVATAAGLATGGVAKAASAAQGMGNLGKAVSAGRDIAKQQGKTGASASLSGLGTAAGQAAKVLPGKVMDAIKGRGGHGAGANLGAGAAGAAGAAAGGRSGQNPGLFDQTKQILQGRAAAGSAANGGSKSGGSSAGAKSSSAAPATPGSSSDSGKSDSASAQNSGKSEAAGSTSKSGSKSGASSAGAQSSSAAPATPGSSSDSGKSDSASAQSSSTPETASSTSNSGSNSDASSAGAQSSSAAPATPGSSSDGGKSDSGSAQSSSTPETASSTSNSGSNSDASSASATSPSAAPASHDSSPDSGKTDSVSSMQSSSTPESVVALAGVAGGDASDSGPAAGNTSSAVDASSDKSRGPRSSSLGQASPAAKSPAAKSPAAKTVSAASPTAPASTTSSPKPAAFNRPNKLRKAAPGSRPTKPPKSPGNL